MCRHGRSQWVNTRRCEFDCSYHPSDEMVIGEWVSARALIVSDLSTIAALTLTDLNRLGGSNRFVSAGARIVSDQPTFAALTRADLELGWGGDLSGACALRVSDLSAVATLAGADLELGWGGDLSGAGAFRVTDLSTVAALTGDNLIGFSARLTLGRCSDAFRVCLGVEVSHAGSKKGSNSIGTRGCGHDTEVIQ